MVIAIHRKNLDLSHSGESPDTISRIRHTGAIFGTDMPIVGLIPLQVTYAHTSHITDVNPVTAWAYGTNTVFIACCTDTCCPHERGTCQPIDCIFIWPYFVKYGRASWCWRNNICMRGS